MYMYIYIILYHHTLTTNILDAKVFVILISEQMFLLLQSCKDLRLNV